jgi:hypothetical protein
MYFQSKNTFKKHITSQYQTRITGYFSALESYIRATRADIRYFWFFTKKKNKKVVDHVSAASPSSMVHVTLFDGYNRDFAVSFDLSRHSLPFWVACMVVRCSWIQN